MQESPVIFDDEDVYGQRQYFQTLDTNRREEIQSQSLHHIDNALAGKIFNPIQVRLAKNLRLIKAKQALVTKYQTMHVENRERLQRDQVIRNAKSKVKDEAIQEMTFDMRNPVTGSGVSYK